MAPFGTGTAFGIDYGPSGPSGGGPVITFVPPTPLPASPFSSMRIEVVGALSALVITVSLPIAGVLEVAYIDSLFGPRYLGPGNFATAISGGVAVELARLGGWPEKAITFRVTAVGDTGVVTVGSYTLATSSPIGLSPTAAEASEEGQVIRALKVDTTTGDIVHDGTRLQFVAGLESIAQGLRTRLSFFQGEWFLDESFGVPYFQSILGKQSSMIAVREIFRSAILDEPGVLSVLSLELREISPREFALSFSVDTDLGELLLVGEDAVQVEVP